MPPHLAYPIHLALHLLVAILLPPLLPGLIAKTKAVMAGRQGPPVLQLYYDLARLARKEAIYSRTTTWIFLAGPVGTVAAVGVASLLMPFGQTPAPVAFEGDVILFAYLFGLARFLTILSALDTGSAFEGMGAAREAAFSALAEPALFLGFAALAKATQSLSLSPMLLTHGAAGGRLTGPDLGRGLGVQTTADECPSRRPCLGQVPHRTLLQSGPGKGLRCLARQRP